MNVTDREQLVRLLPYARRYARALTGDQRQGDDLVAASLRALLAGPPSHGESRLALYREVSRREVSRREVSRQEVSRQEVSRQEVNRQEVNRQEVNRPSADGHGGGTAALTLVQRQLLLLTTLEDFAPDDAADAVGVSRERADALLQDARHHLRASAATDVLIIEDEPIIAMDIEELVASCGHRVVGVATSEAEAVEIARRSPPGLILADVNLGLGGDGAHAVARILTRLQAPVIFVTAYPERLLTGELTEPAFVITKPFEPLTLAIATYQAVTGGVRLD